MAKTQERYLVWFFVASPIFLLVSGVVQVSGFLGVDWSLGVEEVQHALTWMHAHMMLIGFMGFAVMGLLYYVVPRVAGGPVSVGVAKTSFILTAVAVYLMFFLLLFIAAPVADHMLANPGVDLREAAMEVAPAGFFLFFINVFVLATGLLLFLLNILRAAVTSGAKAS